MATLGVVTDSEGRPIAPSTTSRLTPDLPAPPEPTASYPSLDVACDSVDAVLSRRVHETAVRTSDTTLSPWRRAPGSRGCVLRWRGTFKRTPEMSGEVWQGFIDAGWAPANQISADGPDGSAFGMMSRTALCIATTEWDGGDDGDSTYVAEDWWELVVECDDDLTPARRPPD